MKPANELDRHLYAVEESAYPSGVQAACRPVDLQPDWQRIFSDLTGLGVVRLRVENPLVQLESLCEPWSATTADGLACVEGPGIDLLALTSELASATVENGTRDDPGRHLLRWFDWRGGEAMRVALTEDSTWSCFRSILVRQWAQAAAPRTVPSVPATSLGVLQKPIGQSSCSRLPDPRLAWYEAPSPRSSLCDPGGVRPVDPTLIPPFLKTLTDQGCGMRVAVGTGAALQTHDTDFYTFSCREGRLRLSGSTANMVLAHARVGSADLLSSGPGGDSQRCIRLRDQQQRTVAMLGPSRAANADLELWQTLVSALSSE
jgi:hypothetical protein